jgi:hypothetical protein
MTTIPGYYDNHAKLLWQPHLDIITITPSYYSIRTQDHDQFAIIKTPGCHDNHTISPGCHSNHIPGYHNNQTSLPWQPYDAIIITTPAYHDNHTSLQLQPNLITKPPNQVSMAIIPGYHDNHAWSPYLPHRAGIPWQSHQATRTTT